ncbi:endonuclease [Paenibacillus baekrokdamisoli]|uniref:Endonuclease n=1 Tax=Paenibacillus baekrokdamisoli TaxID=1712516 RepID=A0A3G9IVE1_9BACL|nr:endonuclease/exonuclease/phosphatase family protein [Paenibacillus baekrokdamisoli]MBB3068534.1 endonuclease/exonuclease/phosphatase family metal-dependent hydrolase [Paenibacillus baekrokdamisoli]BBH22426.1 endonuclease [Paenibacillus baekrokdamisoli]
MAMNSEPLRGAAPVLKVMTYNIHGGVGTDDALDLYRIASVIKGEEPDFVLLQEVDMNMNRSGKVDQTASLANLTRMSNYVFGRAIYHDGGEYGNAILSKYPLHVLRNLPLPGNEPRAALFVDADITEIYGTRKSITLIVTHLDWDNEQSRTESVSRIETYCASLPRKPAMLCGDLNDTPTSATLTAFQKDWMLESLGQTLLTEPSQLPIHQIDYILYRESNNWTMNAIYVVDNFEASDHKPLVSYMQLSD